MVSPDGSAMPPPPLASLCAADTQWSTNRVGRSNTWDGCHRAQACSTVITRRRVSIGPARRRGGNRHERTTDEMVVTSDWAVVDGAGAGPHRRGCYRGGRGGGAGDRLGDAVLRHPVGFTGYDDAWRSLDAVSYRECARRPASLLRP